jgi:hypothetical protein
MHLLDSAVQGVIMAGIPANFTGLGLSLGTDGLGFGCSATSIPDIYVQGQKNLSYKFKISIPPSSAWGQTLHAQSVLPMCRPTTIMEMV